MAKKSILILLILSVLMSLSLISCSTNEVALRVSPRGDEISADEAMVLLREGNNRFVEGKSEIHDLSKERREFLAKDGQFPYATILSCSDSRVPPEVIFNEGLGNIFVARNAGNVVDKVSLGSIEYSAKFLKVPLIVVLGHTHCGAVKATINNTQAGPNIEEIENLIKPALEIAKKEVSDEHALYEATEIQNVKNSISNIKKSEIIGQLLKDNKVKIVGGMYSLETGKVELIEY
ncbi:MAG: carbonic anhydrase [Clostridium sp.]|uniref:carbonic anhydrase n=1 Tax=Clostridium sp. TaxID=1506 RepID=UPI002FC5881F